MAASPGPSLVVLALSEAFEALWADLAVAHRAALVRVRSAEEVPAGDPVVGIVSAPGDESRLTAVFQDLGPRGPGFAAVGAAADHRVAVAALQAGAGEYFALPRDADGLRRWVRDRIEAARLREGGAAFVWREAARYRLDGIVGESPALRAALERTAHLIPHGSATVLLAGETGTGKELFARVLHYSGPRRSGPFVEIKALAIPETLLESELFGHERGAFVHATSARPGLLEAASGGTLFLDEVGHLSPVLQAKLLGVLQARAYRRLGSTQTRTTEARIIAATQADLAAAVRRGGFRADLYDRLNVVRIELPPLRSRGEDVLLVARHFLRRVAREYRVPPPVLSPQAAARLLAGRWPGNVGELRRVIERAVLLCRGGRIEERDVEVAPAPGPGEAGSREPEVPAPLPFPAPLDAVVSSAIHATLDRCAGNKSEAARRLRISRTRLQRILARPGRVLGDR